MIKIRIKDANGETHSFVAEKLLGGIMTNEPITPEFKPVQRIKFGPQTESDMMSLIEAQLSDLTLSLRNRGLPPDKIFELLVVLTTNSIKSAITQPDRLKKYYRERSTDARDN